MHDREKLLQMMNSLKSDYQSGKLSYETYSRLRLKYEDKLNYIDAMEATRKIRTMQGRPVSSRRKKSIDNRKKEELVQKYIIDPKKRDNRYNEEKSAMTTGEFILICILILSVSFTVGMACGIFTFTSTTSEVHTVAIVEDTAFFANFLNFLFI